MLCVDVIMGVIKTGTLSVVVNTLEICRGACLVQHVLFIVPATVKLVCVRTRFFVRLWSPLESLGQAEKVLARRLFLSSQPIKGPRYDCPW